MIGGAEGTAVDEAEEAAPLPNGDNGLVEGRDNKGRFVKGNKGGPGNPQACNVHAWRQAVTDAVSDKDIKTVTKKLVAAAKAGEPWAIRELMDRTLGKPTVQVELSADVGPSREFSAEEQVRIMRISRMLLLEDGRQEPVEQEEEKEEPVTL